MLKFLRRFKYFDLPLQWAIFLLSLAGLTILYSTSLAGDNLTLVWRQAVFLLIGIAGFIFLSVFDYHTLAKANRLVYVLFILLLLYLLVFGSLIRGGRRWINLGFFNFQPAEFMKLVMILGLAR